MRARIFALVLAVLLLALPLVSCIAPETTQDAAGTYRERFNTLCAELGYDAYFASQADVDVSGDTFTAVMMTGLFTVTGEVKGNRIESLTVALNESAKTYIDVSDDRDAAVLSVLFMASLPILALTDGYETLDIADVQAFVVDTVLASLEKVQLVGDYKLKTAFRFTEDGSPEILSLVMTRVR